MILWTGFLAIIAVFIYYSRFFDNARVAGILSLEFANAVKGKAILTSWYDAGLLRLARRLMWVDFAFIIFYVGIIITLSNRQVRKEPSIVLNALLRANFFFAVLTGLLDISENILLLYDMDNLNDGSYISSCWITWMKFIVAGWAVLVWLVSFVKSRIQ